MSKVEMIMSKCGFSREYAEQVQTDYELVVKVDGVFTVYYLICMGKTVRTPTPLGGWIDAMR